MAELENGMLRQCGRTDLVRDKVLAFARTLRTDDEVALEATGNTMASDPDQAQSEPETRSWRSALSAICDTVRLGFATHVDDHIAEARRDNFYRTKAKWRERPTHGFVELGPA